jgi:hypothetical protein
MVTAPGVLVWSIEIPVPDKNGLKKNVFPIVNPRILASGFGILLSWTEYILFALILASGLQGSICILIIQQLYLISNSEKNIN